MNKILSSLGLVMFFGATALALNSNVAVHAEVANNSNTQAMNNSNVSMHKAPKHKTKKRVSKNHKVKKVKFVDHVQFTYASAKSYNARVVKVNNVKAFAAPYNRGTKLLGKINLQGQLVQLTRVARSPQRVYYKISYRGTNQGWINANYLSKTSVYEIPFTYTSQHFPFDAPNGCEADALKMALSAKNVGLSYGLNYFLQRMPRAKYDQNKGFVGNPYAVNHTKQDWTIYPRALARFGREFRKSVYNITGASKNKIIYEVRHGNPVIAATGYRMRKATGHTLVVVGYKRGYFKMADPSSWTWQFRQNKSLPVFWVSTKQFMNLYNYEGQKAVLVH
jgi:uncharacterized protein YvpB